MSPLFFKVCTMLIEYVTNRSRRNVSEAVGRALILRKIARGVYDTREMKPEALPIQAEAVEISPVTGKPKRKYRRRDMQAAE